MASEMTCSAFSLDAGEPLLGTVKPAQVYFLLEYDGRWEPEAFEGSELPAVVKMHLAALLETVPQSHLLLIRQRPRLVPAGITFYVAWVCEYDPLLFAFSLERYEDLIGLDVLALLDDPPVYYAYRQVDPLVLVCTHGRRDVCCARQGIPVYEALAAQMGAAVWQVSHVGGHRFAANVLCFPHGLVYGRVTPDNAPDLVDAYRAGQIVPELLRGRAVYEPLIQAADVLLRLETGITDLAAFRLINNETSNSGVIQFARLGDGLVHTLEVMVDPAGVRVLGSCGDEVANPQTQYRLIRHTVEHPWR